MLYKNTRQKKPSDFANDYKFRLQSKILRKYESSGRVRTMFYARAFAMAVMVFIIFYLVFNPVLTMKLSLKLFPGNKEKVIAYTSGLDESFHYAEDEDLEKNMYELLRKSSLINERKRPLRLIKDYNVREYRYNNKYKIIYVNGANQETETY